MLWFPTDKADDVKLPVPELSVMVPKVLPLSMMLTEPVGVPMAGGTGATVTVKVTVCPNTEELVDSHSVVLVDGSESTVSVTALEVLEA